MAQPASIVQVAERAGVSVATASRVMSNSTYPVNFVTKEKVLKAAAELNYTPNSLARSLRSQRSNLIAVLVGDNTDPYFAEVMRGVEDVASEHAYLTIICNTDRQPVKEMHYLSVLRDYRVDGIIFAGGGVTEPGYAGQLESKVNEISAMDAAIVTLAQHTLNVASVQADNFGGAREMVNYLISQGHRKIAFVTGPSNLTVANTRLQGYMAALTQAELVIDHNLLINGDFTLAGGEAAVRRLVQLPAELRPTAVFAANDQTAIGLLIGFHKQGWKIPEDISVVGFGNIPTSQAVFPSLTTVDMGLRELGRAGATKLLALLHKDVINQVDILPTSIVERASVARLNSSLAIP